MLVVYLQASRRSCEYAYECESAGRFEMVEVLYTFWERDGRGIGSVKEIKHETLIVSMAASKGIS
jgi:predicted hydrocarbon binding protein